MCDKNLLDVVGRQTVNMVSDAASKFLQPTATETQNKSVTMDDIRLQACAWRMANDYKLSDVADIMGTSSTWLGSFCSAYGTCERPYANQMLKLLCAIGYPYGYAVSIVHSLYPDLYDEPAQWYMDTESTRQLKSVIHEECKDDALADRLTGMLCGPYSYESPFKIHGADTCPAVVGNNPDEIEMRFACATCSHNHLCPDSVVKKRGGGVGLILDSAGKDRSVYVEVYKNSHNIERSRIVTKRFHRIVFDNHGFGMNVKLVSDLHSVDAEYDWKMHNAALSGSADLFFDGRTTDDQQKAIESMIRRSGELDLEDGCLDVNGYPRAKDIPVAADFMASCTDDGVHYIVDYSGEVFVEILDLATKCGITSTYIASKARSMAMRNDVNGSCVMAAYGDPKAAELGIFVDRECARGVASAFRKMSVFAAERCHDGSYGGCDAAAAMLSKGYLAIFVSAAAADRCKGDIQDSVCKMAEDVKRDQAVLAAVQDTAFSDLNSDIPDISGFYDVLEVASVDEPLDPECDKTKVPDTSAFDGLTEHNQKDCFDDLVKRLSIFENGKESRRSARGLVETRARIFDRILPFHHVFGLPNESMYYDQNLIIGMLLSDLVVSNGRGRHITWQEWCSAVDAEKHMMRDPVAEQAIYYKAWTYDRKEYSFMTICELLCNLCWDA